MDGQFERVRLDGQSIHSNDMRGAVSMVAEFILFDDGNVDFAFEEICFKYIPGISKWQLVEPQRQLGCHFGFLVKFRMKVKVHGLDGRCMTVNGSVPL